METPQISLRGVVKKFTTGDFVLTVLKGIDLTINQGELLIITGPSGCGKTTLMNVMVGILDFDEGEILIDKVSLKNFSSDELSTFRRNSVGFVFQSYHLIETLNARQNVCVPLLLNGMREEHALLEADVVLGKVGLSGKEYASPSQLSGGQRQRVAIARALVHNPKIVIFDEPTAALDADSGARVMQLVSEMGASKERYIIVVTHDSRIHKFATRVIEMEDGVIKSG